MREHQRYKERQTRKIDFLSLLPVKVDKFRSDHCKDRFPRFTFCKAHISHVYLVAVPFVLSLVFSLILARPGLVEGVKQADRADRAGRAGRAGG